MDKNPLGPEIKNENKPIETDSQKIVRRHLADEDDEITDEDIRNVRIVGEDHEPTTTGAELASRFLDDDATEDPNEKKETPDKPGTPWTVLSE